MDIKSDRPPYVTFDTRAVEDRNASIETGKYTTRDIDFAFITPQGSKDRIEMIVEEWFDQLDREVSGGRFPFEWLQGFRNRYDAWKKGQELPESGYPLRNWPLLSPAQLQTLLDVGIRTVEDVAGMNEESILRVGMGGRSLKQRAEEWLKTAPNIGKASEEVANLKQENSQLKSQLDEIREEFKKLKESVVQVKK